MGFADVYYIDSDENFVEIILKEEFFLDAPATIAFYSHPTDSLRLSAQRSTIDCLKISHLSIAFIIRLDCPTSLLVIMA